MSDDNNENNVNNVCQHCHIVCKNKYVLQTHLTKSKKCLNLRGLDLTKKFICDGCRSVFCNNKNLSVHTDSCKEYALLNLRKELDTEYQNKIILLEKTLNDVKQTHYKTINIIEEKHEKDLSEQKQMFDKELLLQQKSFQIERSLLEKQIDRLQTSFENLSKEAINRPTTNTTNNNTVNHIRTILSTKHTLDNLKDEDLLLVFREYLTEDVLLGGQQAIAKICNEKIIQTKDDKMLLCCTDASRDKYKYMDNNGNVKEDIYARNFTSKIIKPLETVGQDVYENACASILDELDQLSVIEYGKKASLKNKEERLLHSLVDLKGIDCPNYNTKFLNELAILTKA